MILAIVTPGSEVGSSRKVVNKRQHRPAGMCASSWRGLRRYLIAWVKVTASYRTVFSSYVFSLTRIHSYLLVRQSFCPYLVTEANVPRLRDSFKIAWLTLFFAQHPTKRVPLHRRGECNVQIEPYKVYLKILCTFSFQTARGFC